MSQTNNEAAVVTFHPTALDAAGRPIYKVGKQLRKSVRVSGDPVAEVRWSRSREGWIWTLCQSGKVVRRGWPTKSRDQRNPLMMAAARELHAEAIAPAVDAEAAVTA
jgi:hypothetical protein